MRIKQSSALHKGFTLIELLVVLGISSILLFATMKLFSLFSAIQSEIRLRSDLENIRNLIREHVDCSQDCAGLGHFDLQHIKGEWVLASTCMLNDMYIEYTHSKLNKLPFSNQDLSGPLFSLETGWLCKPRRSKSCFGACHDSTTIGDRGYLIPSLSQGEQTSLLGCANGQLIGTDFALARIICYSEVHAIQDGCTTKETFQDSVLHLQLGGRTPCKNYNQLRVRHADLSHTTLDLNFLNDFLPSSSDSFSIIRAEHLQGRFKNASETLVTDKGTFTLEYSPNEVVLKRFH